MTAKVKIPRNFRRVPTAGSLFVSEQVRQTEKINQKRYTKSKTSKINWRAFGLEERSLSEYNVSWQINWLVHGVVDLTEPGGKRKVFQGSLAPSKERDGEYPKQANKNDLGEVKRDEVSLIRFLYSKQPKESSYEAKAIKHDKPKEEEKDKKGPVENSVEENREPIVCQNLQWIKGICVNKIRHNKYYCMPWVQREGQLPT